MNVGVLGPIELHNRRPVAGIIPEMQHVASLGQVDDVFAVQGVVGHRAVDGFLYPQPFAVVLERRRGAGLAHLLELPALFPGVVPGAVTRRVANGVIGNGGSVIGGQLVLPVAVPVGERHGFPYSAYRPGGVVVPLLVQNVAAQIVGVYPSGAGRAAGGVVLVVYPDQLPQIVVNIVGGLAVLGDGRNVAYIVVGVGEVLARLRNAGNQAGGGAAVVTACQVAVSRGVGAVGRAGAKLYAAIAAPADPVIGVFHLVVIVAVGQLGGLVLGVIGEVCPKLRLPGADPFLEGFQVVVLIVPHLAGVHMAGTFRGGDPHGPVFHVVLAVGDPVQDAVYQLGHLAVSSVLELVRLGGTAVNRYLRDPLVIVIRIRHRLRYAAAVVPVGHFRQRAILQTACRGVVGVGGQRLCAYLHRGRTVLRVKGEVVRYIIGGGGVRIVLDLGQQIAGIGVVVLVGAAAYSSADSGVPFQAVVGVADGLAVGVGHGGDGALVRVRYRGHRLAPGVGLGSHIVRIGRVVVRGGAANHQAAAVVPGLGAGGIALAVVLVFLVDVQRGFAGAQQVLLLFRVAAAPGLRVLHCGRTPRLPVSEHVVEGIIGGMALQRRQILHAVHIAAAVVGERLAEFFPVQEQVAELRLVQVVLVGQADHDLRIIIRHDNGYCSELPAGPFFAPAHLPNTDIGTAAGFLRTHLHFIQARNRSGTIAAGTGIVGAPAARYISVARIADTGKVLNEALGRSSRALHSKHPARQFRGPSADDIASAHQAIIRRHVFAARRPSGGHAGRIHGERAVLQQVIPVCHRAVFHLRRVYPYAADALRRHHAHRDRRRGGVGRKGKRQEDPIPTVCGGCRRAVCIDSRAGAVLVLYPELDCRRVCRSVVAGEGIGLALGQRYILVYGHLACRAGFLQLVSPAAGIYLLAVVRPAARRPVQEGGSPVRIDGQEMMVLQVIVHGPLHLGRIFRMVQRHGGRIPRKASIPQSVVYRYHISRVIEMIHQGLSGCQGAAAGRNHFCHSGTAVSVFVLPSAADRAVLVFILYQGDAVRSLAGIGEFQRTVVMVGHFVQQTGGGIVGVLNILAVLMGDLGQLIAGQNGRYRIHSRRSDAGRAQRSGTVRAIFDSGSQAAAVVGEGNGIAQGVRHGLDHLHIAVIVIEFSGGKIKGHGVVALVGNGGGGTGNGQFQRQAGQIVPGAGGLLEVMPGAVPVHIYIVQNRADRLFMQGLLGGIFPAIPRAEGVHILIAAVIVTGHRERHQAAVHIGILMRHYQIAVKETHISGTRTAAIVAFLRQVPFQTGQADIVNGHIGLVVGSAHGSQLHQSVLDHFKPQTVIGSRVPLTNLIGDVEVDVGAFAVGVGVFQILIADVDFAVGRFGIGDGCSAPIVQHFPQIDMLPTICRSRCHGQRCGGHIIGRIDFRQRIKAQESIAFTPVIVIMGDIGAVSGGRIVGGRMNGSDIRHGNGVGGLFRFHNGIQTDRESGVGGEFLIQRNDPGPVSPIQFLQGNICAAGYRIALFIHGERRGEAEDDLVFIQGQNVAVFLLNQAQIRRIEVEFHRTDCLIILKDEGILEAARQNLGGHIHAGKQFGIQHGAFQGTVFIVTGEQERFVLRRFFFFRFHRVRVRKDPGQSVGTAGQSDAAARGEPNGQVRGFIFQDVFLSGQGMVDLFPFSLSVPDMDGFRIQNGLIMAAAQVVQFTGLGSLLFHFPTGQRVDLLVAQHMCVC